MVFSDLEGRRLPIGTSHGGTLFTAWSVRYFWNRVYYVLICLYQYITHSRHKYQEMVPGVRSRNASRRRFSRIERMFDTDGCTYKMTAYFMAVKKIPPLIAPIESTYPLKCSKSCGMPSCNQGSFSPYVVVRSALNLGQLISYFFLQLKHPMVYIYIYRFINRSFVVAGLSVVVAIHILVYDNRGTLLVQVQFYTYIKPCACLIDV